MIDKVVIVGAGLTGSVLARLFAEKGKLGVTVLDRRNHVGGNVYDYQNEAGICIQKYGPHAFHTNSTKVYDFITEYGRWIPYELRVRVALSGKMTPSPFNLRTIDDFYSQKDARRLKKSLEEAYPGKGTITVTEMMASENTLIKAHAQMLFDKDYRLYTAKQWGIPVSQIDRRILERVPIRLDYQDRYFDDEYQCQPAQGYTQFIENLLNHPGISVEINREALKDINFDEGNNRVSFKGISLKEKILLVYTGAIDELFDYRFGELPYRSLKFQYQTHHRDSFQEVPIVAYPQDPHFTRITEFKKLYPAGVAGVTTIAYEYPLSHVVGGGRDPYYPVLTKDSMQRYQEYREASKRYRNLVLCGRLADFQYYDMDQAIEKALSVFEGLSANHSN